MILQEPQVNLYPIPRDDNSMSVACLIGCRLKEVDSSAAPDQWVLRFDSGCMLNAEGTWRIICSGRIVATSKDHQQLFGLSEPVDAAEQMHQAIAASRVTTVSYDRVTGDLRIDFENGARFEVLTDSGGYESWTLSRPDGTQLIGMGGGEVIPYGPGPDQGYYPSPVAY